MASLVRGHAGLGPRHLDAAAARSGEPGEGTAGRRSDAGQPTETRAETEIAPGKHEEEA